MLQEKRGKKRKGFFFLYVGVIKFLWGNVLEFIRIHKGKKVIFKCIPTEGSRNRAKNTRVRGGSFGRESRETPRKVHRKR